MPMAGYIGISGHAQFLGNKHAMREVKSDPAYPAAWNGTTGRRCHAAQNAPRDLRCNANIIFLLKP